MNSRTRFKRRRANGSGPAWTKHEKVLLWRLATGGRNAKHAQSLLLQRRSAQAIRDKLRKVRIKSDAFGESYRTEKAGFTEEIARQMRPRVVFEAYAGAGHQTLQWLKKAKCVYAADRDPRKIRMLSRKLTDAGFEKRDSELKKWSKYVRRDKSVFAFSGTAILAAANLASESRRIDTLDLDTCGSTLPTVSTFLALLKPRTLVITHGEYHSLRFRRLDVLTRLLHRFAPSNCNVSRQVLTASIEKAMQLDALRAGNSIDDSFWLEPQFEKWLGSKNKGMLRRVYAVQKPASAADCLNELLGRH